MISNERTPEISDKRTDSTYIAIAEKKNHKQIS